MVTRVRLGGAVAEKNGGRQPADKAVVQGKTSQDRAVSDEGAAILAAAINASGRRAVNTLHGDRFGDGNAVGVVKSCANSSERLLGGVCASRVVAVVDEDQVAVVRGVHGSLDVVGGGGEGVVRRHGARIIDIHIQHRSAKPTVPQPPWCWPKIADRPVRGGLQAPDVLDPYRPNS